MTRQEYQRACDLADQALGLARKDSPTYRILSELRELIDTPPTMEQIVMKVDAANHKERALKIGLSRQAYYNLMRNMARPSLVTVYRLAELTGVDAETIKEVW
jgi:transcriptional regulator with XRE-family HTH domain